MKLDVLYHWSPCERREAVRAEGLRLHSAPTTASGDHTWPYLCFGTTPSLAWGLSGDTHSISGIEVWDLWQVRLIDGDDVHVLAEFGPTVREVRTYTAIPADRLWLVGTRQSPCAERRNRSQP